MISEPWYVRHKPCTYLAPTLTLSRNGPKWDSTWPTSPKSSLRCKQYYFCAYGMFKANRAPILHRNERCPQTDRNEIHKTHIIKEFHRVFLKLFLRLWHVWSKPCTYLALTLWLFPNAPKWHSTWPHHLGVPSGASKMISEPLECLVQTVLVSCTDTSTVSKKTKTRFHMTHII
jgi:hypothetical protein